MLSPSATDDDSSFAAPWLRFARRGWSSGGAIAIGSQNKLRMGLFNGRASWDRYQPQEKLQGHGAMLEYSLGYPGSNLHSLSVQTGFVREQNSFLGPA